MCSLLKRTQLTAPEWPRKRLRTLPVPTSKMLMCLSSLHDASLLLSFDLRGRSQTVKEGNGSHR